MSKNTRSRYNRIRANAEIVVEQHGAATDIQTLRRFLRSRINCHRTTADRHIRRAIKRRQGEPDPEWGGARPGAGRPST